MKTICKINNYVGETVHEFTFGDGKLYADGKLVGEYETEEEAIEAVWHNWHEGEWDNE